MNKWRTAILAGIRTAIGVGILVWLLVRFDFAAAWQAGKDVDIGLLLLSAVFFLLPPLCIQPFKYRWMVNHMRGHSFWLIIRLSMVGYFFNQFLPTSIGGDAIKVLWLSKKYGKWKAYMLAALADRMSGGVVLLVGMVGYLWWKGFPQMLSLLEDSVFLIVVVVTIGLLLFAAVKLSYRRYFQHTVQQLLPFVSGRNIAVIGALSLLAHMGYWCSTWVLLEGLGVSITWWQAFFVLSGSAFMASLPVSLGGIGLREGAMVAILITMDVSEAVALHVAILQRLLIFAVALAGGVIYAGMAISPTESDKVTHADNTFQ